MSFIQVRFKTRQTESLQEDGFIAAIQDSLTCSVKLWEALMNGLLPLTTFNSLSHMLMTKISWMNLSRSRDKTNRNWEIGSRLILDMTFLSIQCMTSRLKEFMNTRDSSWTSCILFIDTFRSLQPHLTKEKESSCPELLWLVVKLPQVITMLKQSLSLSPQFLRKLTATPLLETFWRWYSFQTITFLPPKLSSQPLSYLSTSLQLERRHQEPRTWSSLWMDALSSEQWMEPMSRSPKRLEKTICLFLERGLRESIG